MMKIPSGDMLLQGLRLLLLKIWMMLKALINILMDNSHIKVLLILIQEQRLQMLCRVLGGMPTL